MIDMGLQILNGSYIPRIEEYVSFYFATFEVNSVDPSFSYEPMILCPLDRFQGYEVYK